MKHKVYWIEGDGIGPEIWKVTRPVLDAAMKAADVELVTLFEPPSETNFGGGLLTGTQSACHAAAAAFAQRVKEIAQRPREV